MQPEGGGALPLVLIDYAHTPDALAKALHAARAHCRGRLWCVFGCGGERDPGKRAEMGRIAAAAGRCSSSSPTTIRAARTRSAIVAAIMQGIIAAGGAARTRVIHDRAQAIRARCSAAPRRRCGAGGRQGTRGLSARRQRAPRLQRCRACVRRRCWPSGARHMIRTPAAIRRRRPRAPASARIAPSTRSRSTSRKLARRRSVRGAARRARRRPRFRRGRRGRRRRRRHRAAPAARCRCRRSWSPNVETALAERGARGARAVPAGR